MTQISKPSLRELHAEFIGLKTKLFQGQAFVLIPKRSEMTRQEAIDHDRYDQLFQFFNPSFRTSTYVSPLN